VAPVAEIVEAIAEAGLPYQVTALETLVEGEWAEVMPVIHKAYQHVLHRYDRVFLELRIDEHRGEKSRMRAAVDDVDRALGHLVAR
jgi:uncharacterized protein YqgV (UPF0045/DUF77 family)